MILLFFILLIDFLATGEDKYPLVINDSEKFARKRHWPFLSGLKCFPSLKTGEHQKAPLSVGNTFVFNSFTLGRMLDCFNGFEACDDDKMI